MAKVGPEISSPGFVAELHLSQTPSCISWICSPTRRRHSLSLTPSWVSFLLLHGGLAASTDFLEPCDLSLPTPVVMRNHVALGCFAGITLPISFGRLVGCVAGFGLYLSDNDFPIGSKECDWERRAWRLLHLRRRKLAFLYLRTLVIPLFLAIPIGHSAFIR
ncbi:hypothetical protein CRG98_011086 [Punica granatum]|uniref:Uncharacterized protein n=1 Tax=Punica granatum TaxID=22663 RepID=A0A2I0KJ35_PUNGR|nr:hypothetical protein CRG98_011086 [Punica granatum]